MTQDLVNYPPHYTQHPSGVEQIELSEHMTFNVGNAFKYLHRAALKGNEQQDLEKAAWYIEREIKRCPNGGFWLNIDWMYAEAEGKLYFEHETCPVRKNLYDFTRRGNSSYLKKAAEELEKMMQAKPALYKASTSGKTGSMILFGIDYAEGCCQHCGKQLAKEEGTYFEHGLLCDECPDKEIEVFSACTSEGMLAGRTFLGLCQSIHYIAGEEIDNLKITKCTMSVGEFFSLPEHQE
ncbi:DUF3310 domain-containing protein [Halodesulfovibrio aestuarii]|uniref:DUF3310 domain-containing protein n=1 Tax=Halodesulfovibrio aestuarii TaxID=126333 RepID=A0ABV4JMU5_9BACT